MPRLARFRSPRDIAPCDRPGNWEKKNIPKQYWSQWFYRSPVGAGSGWRVVNFNKRHRRHGHLFQNRYKSIVCQEDAYLKELVRYIHLNPLRAKIVSDIKELNKYAYSGHPAGMTKAGVFDFLLIHQCWNKWLLQVNINIIANQDPGLISSFSLRYTLSQSSLLNQEQFLRMQDQAPD